MHWSGNCWPAYGYKTMVPKLSKQVSDTVLNSWPLHHKVQVHPKRFHNWLINEPFLVGDYPRHPLTRQPPISYVFYHSFTHGNTWTQTKSDTGKIFWPHVATSNHWSYCVTLHVIIYRAQWYPNTNNKVFNTQLHKN